MKLFNWTVVKLLDRCLLQTALVYKRQCRKSFVTAVVVVVVDLFLFSVFFVARRLQFNFTSVWNQVVVFLWPCANVFLPLHVRSVVVRSERVPSLHPKPKVSSLRRNHFLPQCPCCSYIATLSFEHGQAKQLYTSLSPFRFTASLNRSNLHRIMNMNGGLPLSRVSQPLSFCSR